MNPGKLDSKINLVEMVETISASRDIVFTPTIRAQGVAASAKQMKGRELEQARALYSEAEYLFVIRFGTNVSPYVSAKHHVTWKTADFELVSAGILVPTNRPQWIHIYAKKRN